MPLQRQVAGGSYRRWLVCAPLTVAIAVLGYFTVTFTLANVIVDDDPAFAHALAPYDGRITAQRAASLSNHEATGEDRRQADDLARLALRQDLTAVAAASTLGVNADVRGEKAAAHRYFNYANKLSRRDIRTQLWMIEDAVERGDVPAALGQYDMTLRVFPGLSDILYPIMASATEDPQIRKELVRTLAAQPLWAEGFLSFAAVKGSNPVSIAALFQDLRRAGVAVPDAARAGAVNALIAAGQVNAAWSYYATLRPGVDRGRSRDPHFEAGLEAPSQLDWLLVNERGLTASIENGVLDFGAPPSVGGPLLLQLQLLTRGRYRLAGHSAGIGQRPGARPYWVLSCRGGRELGRVELPNSGMANGSFGGEFNVPADCPVQTLMLMARPSDALSGVSGQIDSVQLVPIGR